MSDPLLFASAAAAAAEARRRLAGLAAIAVVAVAAYVYGLDSHHAPKNGDEYAYEHIARLTAASGALLPLRTDVAALRNTKPPFLFWQGIASTNGGRDWTLARLRWPSVAYTLATAALAFAVGRRLSGRADRGLLAALVFLAFFSTYRYGRPFLTNAPETFWLFLPFAVLLLRPGSARATLLPFVVGVPLGVALLYKSFALAAPAGLALAAWRVRLRGGRLAEAIRHDGAPVALALAIAVSAFAAWFALDPAPAAVWTDFVLRENAGKFSLPGGYVPRLLWGPSSLWAYALAFAANAGLLLPAALATCVLSWRRRRELSEGERLLWLLVLSFALFYALPSQRSSRYLLPVMPALAVLVALAWERLARWLFLVTLAATAVVVVGLAVASRQVDALAPWARDGAAAHWALLATTAAVAGLGLVVARLTRACALTAVFLAYLSLASTLRPFDGPAGRYDAAAVARARGRAVLVPYDFVAKEERYRFVLPGATPVGYREDGRGPARPADPPPHALVVMQAPVGGEPCGGCTVLGRRLDLRGRQSAAEVREILAGRLSPALVVEELLVETGDAPGGPAARP
ncbi:MAG: phospholipid carrier-dependent glycosyltransferase [Vicinamibacteria bacterium]